MLASTPGTKLTPSVYAGPKSGVAMEKGPHRTDAVPFMSARRTERGNPAHPLDRQDRIRRSNPRQAPPRFATTIKVPFSETGPSFAELFQAVRFSRGGKG